MATPASGCGLNNALRFIHGKWKPTIIWVLHAGPLHFGELLREVERISEKVLTEQLRELERDCIVLRVVKDERVRRVSYELTASGMALNDAVHALASWGNSHTAIGLEA